MKDAAMRVRHVFRAMKAEGMMPLTGRSRRTLGAIPGEPPKGDIPVGRDGCVAPRTGGMSVAPDDPINLPRHRRPPTLGGEGRDPVFRYATTALPATLALCSDHPEHAFMEPCNECMFDEYQTAIHGTRSNWEVYDV